MTISAQRTQVHNISHICAHSRITPLLFEVYKPQSQQTLTYLFAAKPNVTMKNMHDKTLMLVPCILGTLVISSPAAVLFGWDNNNTSHGDNPWTPAVSETNLSGGSITMGSGLVLGPTNGPGAAVAMKYEGFASTTTTQATSASSGEYLEWTINVTSGFAMDVTNLEIATANLNELAPTLKLELRSSADGYGSTLGAIQIVTTSGDLGAIVFDVNQSGLSGSVTYRLYGYWDDAVTLGSDATNLHFRTDKASLDSGHLIAMNGEVVAVPEAGTTALLGLAGLGLMLRRRR